MAHGREKEQMIVSIKERKNKKTRSDKALNGSELSPFQISQQNEELQTIE